MDFIDQLKAGFPASPGVRAHWVVIYESSSEDSYSHSVERRQGKLDADMGRVRTLFKYLWEPPKWKMFKVYTLVEVLRHLLQNNPHAKHAISSWVASRLCQLSIFSECLRQLKFFQPWAKKIQVAIK
jgi:hypothetical protein